MNLRFYGASPHAVAVIHGGPGAAGEMAPVARELAAAGRGVLEPLQTATTVEGQVAELQSVLAANAELPVVLVGYSWGAWLSLLVAARHPGLVRKLILVSSGPFEERYVARLHETRWRRLTDAERMEFASALAALSDPDAPNKDAMLARLGALSSKSDAFDPLPEEPGGDDLLSPQGETFQRVWEEASAMRRTGELLRAAEQVRCPVVAFHGDSDAHPADGVREPLSAVLPHFRFRLLLRCGHTPWRERQAREGFYRLLGEELRPASGAV